MGHKTIQTRHVLTKIFVEAEKRAKAEGLSSLQDAVRIFLVRYAQGDFQIGLIENIRPEKEEEYLNDSKQLEKELASGKSKFYNNSNDLLKELRK
ncbi:MAG TPA: hypothetical protein VJC17_04675 [Candidatus Dojkabacteria bacterium]|nr:hypothetical protein [Candidatus Dojkabacteria bacterium]